jgi:hypothetical protein
VDGLIAAVVLGIAFAAVLVALVGLGRRVRRRGSAGGQAFVGPFEEMWHPAAHRARLATETVEERMMPGPSADDTP